MKKINLRAIILTCAILLLFSSRSVYSVSKEKLTDEIYSLNYDYNYDDDDYDDYDDDDYDDYGDDDDDDNYFGKTDSDDKDWYANNLKYTSKVRTDIYALDTYRQQSDQYSEAYIQYLNETAKSIVKGISSDYEKVKAISSWVSTNLWYYYGAEVPRVYNYFNSNDTDNRGPYGIENIAGDTSGCGGYATFTEGLLRAAGFPAKYISGIANNGVVIDGHAWVEAFVDGRWIFIDPTWNSYNKFKNGVFSEQRNASVFYFDLPVEKYSYDHQISLDGHMEYTERYAWDGSLIFTSTGNYIVKIVENFPVNGLLTSTYGFEADELYWDAMCTIPVNLQEDRINSNHCNIFVKNPSKKHVVTFDSCGGTPVDSVTIIGREDNNYLAKIPKPKNPSRVGYKFMGWETKPTDGWEWEFDIDEENTDITLYATWKKEKKAEVKYKVTFQSNKGTKIETITVKGNSKLSKPSNPKRKDYQFVGWYSDKNLKKAWNFKNNKVTGNTTLYAKWKKVTVATSKHKVSFQSNNGVSISPIYVETSSKLSKPKNPKAKKGYQFVAWYKDSKLTKKWDFKVDKVTENTVIYAKWKKI